MSRIRTNALSLVTSFFGTAVLVFIQFKILTNYLDQFSVGVWSAVMAVGALLSTLSELGLPAVLIRFGAKYDASFRLARLSKLWKFALRVYVLAMIMVLGLLVLAGPRLASILGEGEIDRRLLILGYLTVASGTMRGFNNASFRGLRRMTAIAVLEIAMALIITVGFFTLRHRLSVPLVLTVSLTSSLLMAGIGMVVLLRFLAPLRAKALPEVLNPPVVPEVKGFWQGAAATSVFIVAIEQLDKPLLAGLVSFEMLAVFHVAARLALFARRLIYVPFMVMNPEVTHKWESGRRAELAGDMELFTKLALGLGLSLVVFLAVFARPLILLVSTSDFLGAAPVLWMFTGVIPILCLHQPMAMFLRAIGRVWSAFIGDAAWLVTYLGVGTLLVGRFGLPGFVAGQIGASLLILGYYLTVFHRLELPRPGLGFFARRLVLGAGVCGASVGAGWALPAWSWWQLCILALGLAGLGNFFLVRGRFLTRAEEDRTLAMLTGRGLLGQAGRFLLGWPHGRAGRAGPADEPGG